MKTGEIHKLYTYHFALNRKVWDEAISQLSEEQFVQDLPYSVGSVRNQVVHMIDTDDNWFGSLRGSPRTSDSDLADYPDRESVRTYWDQVETTMKNYLDGIDDAALDAPFPNVPADMQVWQVLIHVLAHGIDHRAQLLAMLNQLGAETFPQDYALFLFGRI